MSFSVTRALPIALAVLAAVSSANAEPISILFVGNSYTFGRTPLNPNGTLNTANNVLTYNSANVRDLTKPQGPLVNSSTSSTPKFSDVTGTNSYPIGMNIFGTSTQGNSYSPHSQTQGWGGMPGIFKQLTVQANLDYDVALSTRNAASLRGHLLNTSNNNWDLRGNISSKKWDKVVLQEQSDEALPPQTVGGVALGSNFPSVRAYVDLIEDWIHKGKVTIGLGIGQTEVTTYTEQAMFLAQYGTLANCVAAGNTSAICNSTTNRNLGTNANASTATEVYLQQTWARPDLINSPGTKTLNPITASATYDITTPVPSYYNSLESMTAALVTGMLNVANFADDDGTSGIKGIIPTGQAFLAAVQTGFATRNMYATDALTDNLIDLWFNDGTHPSVAGSYLSALTTFGSVTGLDPAMFGADERAAKDLGLSRYEAYILQNVASYQLGFRSSVPEPGTLVLVAAALGLMGAAARRRKAKQTA